MSSILKALKKLESEKGQRDELSTAVASDILRSSRNKRVRSFSLVLAGFAMACVAMAVFSYFIRGLDGETAQTPSAASTGEISPDPINGVSAVAGKTVSRPDASPLPVLSGIIYQSEAASRMAIINDLPVMEGTRVDGFTIQEILPQKVVIARAGQRYDLLLPAD